MGIERGQVYRSDDVAKIVDVGNKEDFSFREFRAQEGKQLKGPEDTVLVGKNEHIRSVKKRVPESGGG